MNVLVWYKRDLRVSDHPALAFAGQAGAVVLPLYIAEPEYWALPESSGRQWAFVAEALAGLRADLAALGAPLVVRVGDAVEVLARICRQNAITRIVSHSEPGQSWAAARDQRVRDWARGAGIEWVELAAEESAEALEPVVLRGVSGLEPGVIPPARALRLADDPCPHRQTGGRVQAEALLRSFLDHRGLGYRAGLDSPLGGERGCSRLSPYLAQGVISRRAVRLALAARVDLGPEWAGNLRDFQGNLMRSAEFTSMDAPNAEANTRMVAWLRGESGFPFVDAAMRYLAASGWLNFRARAMLVSVARQHFGLNTQAIGTALARRFTDYDPVRHWPQVHLATDGRVFHPVKEGALQDPSGAFTRRWVPELAGLPDAFLQCPWKYPQDQGGLARRYPAPIVALASPRAVPTERAARPVRPAPLGQLVLDL